MTVSPSSHLVAGFDYHRSPLALMKLAFQPLDEPETRSLLKMTERWIDYLNEQRIERRVLVLTDD